MAGRMQKGEPSGDWLTWSGATGAGMEMVSTRHEGHLRYFFPAPARRGLLETSDFLDLNREGQIDQRACAPRVEPWRLRVLSNGAVPNGKREPSAD